MSVAVARGGADPLQPLSSRDTRPSLLESSVQKVGHPSTSSNPGVQGSSGGDVFTTLNIPSSEQFGKVMQDIQSRRQEHLRRIQEQLRAERERQGGDVRITHQNLRDLIAEEEDEEDGLTTDGSTEPTLTPLQQTARRAWARIRRYIQEQAMKNRNQKSKLQWSMLKQTLSHMNNMQQARADLYDRYLYRPESWTEGLTKIPENIFKKTRGGRYVYFANPTDFSSPRPSKQKDGDQGTSSPAKAPTRKSKSPTRDRKVSDKETRGREKGKKERSKRKV